VSIINHHDYVFLGEGHRVAPIRVLVEFRTLGRGPRDHETLHHVTVLELVPHRVCVVWEGRLEESLEVVGRRLRLMLVIVRASRDTTHVGIVRLPVVAIVVVGRDRSPLWMLLAPPLVTLTVHPSALDGDVGWRLPVTAWGHLPASWRKTKFGCLTIGGVLGGDAA
jgi:hypothetical protein